MPSDRKPSLISRIMWWRVPFCVLYPIPWVCFVAIFFPIMHPPIITREMAIAGFIVLLAVGLIADCVSTFKRTEVTNAPSRSSLILPIAVALTVLLALYVGAYYAMVEPLHFEVGTIPFYAYRGGDTPIDYGWEQDCLQAAFSPIHWLDRRIRPSVWEPTQ